MNQPLVSVIMAVRNGERFLAQAIESVLAQDYQTIEILLIDGQSNDRTAEIARSFPRIGYMLQPDRGIPNAYNLGVQSAAGEFLAFLSHDDLWMPDKISCQLEMLIKNPLLGYCVAQTQFFLDEGCDFPSHALREEILVQPTLIRIMESVMFRKTVFERVGLFNPTYTTAEDVDWFVRAEDLGIQCGVVHKVLLHKRIHAANTSVYARENMRNVFDVLRRSARRKREHKENESR